MHILSVSVGQFNGISCKCTQTPLHLLSLNCPGEQLSDYDCNIWKVDMHCDHFLWVFDSEPPCWQEERRAEHMKMWCGETGLLKAIATENSITELDDLISSCFY